jgi:hypothetical protein
VRGTATGVSFAFGTRKGFREGGRLAGTTLLINALLVVDGNPLEDIAILQNRDNLQPIMKVGRTIKNELEAS